MTQTLHQDCKKRRQEKLVSAAHARRHPALVPCDFPLKAYRSASRKGATGLSLLTFNPLEAINSTSPMEIPCNNCMGCKLEKSRQWAVRMLHESKLYDQNSFLTLTYSDETIPTDYGLSLRHLQLFIKRLRKSLPQKIRFFACGEYGDQTQRPHYHAIVFNYQPNDQIKHSLSPSKQIIYTSQKLQDLWQLGFATSQTVTYQSCAYVARYVTKKIKTGDDFGAQNYFRLSPVDLLYHSVKPEFAVMSRRPGIGYAYTQKFKRDYYPSGYIVVNGVRQAPPKYYVSQLSEEEQTKLKRQARRLGLKNKPHQTTERRLARAAVRDARITNLKRGL
ncbi:replication initiator protein [Blackfly microvirus SF02]|uniref:Replication initiator protein n=1 Tax=Blackfly microvirus SF02 TaxID=2576452 RepID=A0A4P8PJJ0_9VIRU|nr:replication initiator protein [Blackfly microvirus SF02]